MYIKEQYIMNDIAYQLVHNGGYEILYITDHNDEIWLEKYKDRVSNVIRLTNKGFDWKNYLKADLSNVFRKVTAMGNMLIGKQVEIYNIYVSQFAPVDEWEILKRPIKYNRNKQMNMHVYYVSEEDYKVELARISENVHPIVINQKVNEQQPFILEEKNQYFKDYLHSTLQQTREEAQSVFSFGKPMLTYILMFLNIGFFFIVEAYGSSTEIPHLIRFGAKYNPAIIDGEWWRIVSSMFLHIGIVHLLMNMLALYYLGVAVERIFGSIRFIFIYLLAGIGGGIASFTFTINVSAGASGAIFGLFGALLFFGLHQRKLFLQTMGRGILILIGINIVFGFLVPQIDNSAHLGGLIAGFLSSAIVHLPKMRQLSKQLIAFVIYCLMILSLIFYGFQNGMNVALYYLDQIDHLLESDDYEQIVTYASKGLMAESDKEFESQLYFQRSYAYIELGQYDLAITDLENSTSIQPEFAKAHYNLALLYYETGQHDLAQQSVQEAYELDPTDEAFIELYEKIMGVSLN